MARKLGVLGLALFMGVVAFTLGVASASSGITAPLAITVIEHPDHYKVIDVGKKGDSTGDIFTFHNDLTTRRTRTSWAPIPGSAPG